MPPPTASPTGCALGVIVLGAGASTRMGRPKLLLPWGEATIIGHIIGQWRALGASQIAVVCAPGDIRLQAELDYLDHPQRDRIENPQPGRGMFSSVLCAAQWNGWQPDLTAWAVVLGDQPHLRPASLRALLDFAVAHPGAICQPARNGRGRHPVVLPRRGLDELRRSPAPSLRDFLRASQCALAQCPMEDPALDLDLDSPADYDNALRLFHPGE